jgi:hypothetical protein
MDNKPFLVIVLGIAFVALVLPFDSFRGLRQQFAAPFCRARGCLEVWETIPRDQERQSNFNIEVVK